MIRELRGGGEGAKQSGVVKACSGNVRRTVYQLQSDRVEISIVGSKTMISSSALLLRFDGQYDEYD